MAQQRKDKDAESESQSAESLTFDNALKRILSKTPVQVAEIKKQISRKPKNDVKK